MDTPHPQHDPQPPAHDHGDRPGHDHDHQHDHGHDHDADGDFGTLAEMLDLDAEVLHAHLAEVVASVRALADGAAVGRVLDLGAGTGTGTLALARAFEQAEIVAVDRSPEMLARLDEKAARLGFADRVSTVAADLDTGWPPVGTFDLVWASASLHHMADPARTLKEILAALRPGGLLAVVELDGLPRFLPDDLGIGRPGLEARVHTMLSARHATDVPHLGAAWGGPLAAAGFTVESERTYAIELRGPDLHEATGRYARATLRRVRDHLGDRLEADDLATLDTLLDGAGPESLLRRDDLTVRATREVWTARRP
ncbi:class I SAM-dependent methyltransferase [uncultured Streptomyces sp.]|uniref:class I SAM-dependent methyltransferase n=1 Tax=uncultured Streptomyces sp. TaxID=174707 RepID=UPI00261E4D51|nr:class I SAM-dependent methyltransferase [uncultured Streptomyces sp.]